MKSIGCVAKTGAADGNIKSGRRSTIQKSKRAAMDNHYMLSVLTSVLSTPVGEPEPARQ